MPTIKVSDRLAKATDKTYNVPSDDPIINGQVAVDQFIKDSGVTPYVPGKSRSRYYARFLVNIVPYDSKAPSVELPNWANPH